MAWAGSLKIQPHKEPKSSTGWFFKFTFEKQISKVEILIFYDRILALLNLEFNAIVV